VKDVIRFTEAGSAYAAADALERDGMHYRRDIGGRAMGRER
jgi:phosphoribosylamine-glycine ligase